MDPLIESLTRAVEASPDDPELRLHLAELLVGRGRGHDAIAHLSEVLRRTPADERAQHLMSRALAPADPATASAPASEPTGFDWSAAEEQVGDIAAPMFVEEAAAPEPPISAYDAERSSVTLADVGGMESVKERLTASFLAPLRNPELRKLYGKSLRGGLLMWGPPGCGKTYIARAVAGELAAKFINVGIADVLDPMLGSSERNVHEVFQLARREAPAVVFLDELDTLGQRRSQTRNTATRGVVNQLLQELDGAEADNEGVFVLAATNQPWDVDPAMRRPGRFDRTVFVQPPDAPARAAILRSHLQHRPIEGVDVGKLARAGEGFSGADLAYVCEAAAEHALLDSVRTGKPRMINQADLERALRGIQPSTGPWFDSARNVVLFANQDGTYDELKAYLKKSKR